MRMFRYCHWVIAVLVFTASAVSTSWAQNASLPAIPGCTCSTGTEIEYPAALNDKKVFAANCICGPQFCAATWNQDIALQCVAGATDIGTRPNCADFTKLKVGIHGTTLTAGLFRVDTLPSTTRPNGELEVKFDEIGSNTPPVNGPNGLHTAPGAAFSYPQLYKRAEVDLATYIGGGNYLSIVTGRNEVVQVPYAADPISGKTINLVVEHPDGIKTLRFPENEVLVFQVCAKDALN
ncbi:hypothetical protein ACCT07_02905 [Rhizobium johnstonii]|uniref:hypothetical protein n=1 Tax=Rhizobium johnstonii TaxID=3019933 RepID=UPI003F960480